MAVPVVLENQVERCGRVCAGCAVCVAHEKRPMRLTTEWNEHFRPKAYAEMKKQSLAGGGAMVREDPHTFNAQQRALRQDMTNDGFTQEEQEEYFKN